MPSSRLLRSLPAGALLLAAACGNDTAATATLPTASATGTGASTADATSATPTTGGTVSPTTSDGGSGTDTGTTGTTAEITGSTSSSTWAPTTEPDPSTSTSTTGTTTDQTSDPCACTPGEPGGCDGNQQLVCADDCTGFVPQPCPNGQQCVDGACSAMFCQPGSVVCDSPDAYKQCDDQGGGYGPPVPCAADEGCSFGACVSLCELAESEPSTIGCSFIAARVDNIFGDETDSLIVGNVSKTKSAQVQFYFTPTGTNTEQPQGAPQMIPPGGTVSFQMTNPPLDKVSGLRKGGSYRVQSSIPVIAYQHSPLSGQATNDASVLFPEHALRQNHYIASWKDVHSSYPSYFNVIAIEDSTTVTWTPSQNTLAGTGVPAVTAGQTGQVVMNRFDTLQVRAPYGGDLTGTFVGADKPIWVLGAAECINIPTLQFLYCDHIQEQMLALDYWGTKYVGAHSPKRGTEKHYYRIFAGEDNVTVTTSPQQPGTPFMLNKGEWKELVVANGVSFMIEGSGPILPVQYLESQTGGGGTGDPAMYQMIPVEQFLSAYAFVTGTGYDVHYAQITRVAGGPDVLVDGQVVSGYYTVGQYEVSDWKISEGAHFAESDAPFGIVSVGYTDATSYAYPGGLRLAVINPQ